MRLSDTNALVLVTLLGLIGNSTAIVQPLLVGLMVDSYGLTPSAAGMVSAVEMTAFGGAALLIAAVVSRFDRRGLCACALGMAAAGNLAASFAGDTTVLVLSRVVAGAGAGASLAISGAIIAGHREPDRVYSITTMGMLAYAGVFLTTVPNLMQAWGSAAAFLVMAAIAALTLPFAFAAPRPPARTTDAAAGAGRRPPLRDAAPLLAAALVLYAGHGAVWTYEERMGVAIGMSVAEVGGTLGLASIAGFIGAAIAAILGSRISRTASQVIALGLSATAAVIIVLARTPELYTAGACLIALAWFFGLPYLNGVAAGLDPEGRTAALTAAMLNFGTALGPFLASLILVANGYLWVGVLAATMYLACLGLIVPLARRLDRTRGRHGLASELRPGASSAAGS
ncbi:MAG: MFS transporter [Phenylobacterium sp.]|uniref:MFS transporter n=1 Tax=Phenylobacterium sp. TaxID=1871053 RepID=UPI0027355E59|nr:MFS transporter [Phenylobacterium sp.]MDP3749557.1 MFS transporter [Phenylobacterium sp.]